MRTVTAPHPAALLAGVDDALACTVARAGQRIDALAMGRTGEPSEETEAERASKTIKKRDRKLVRYREALEAGADAPTGGGANPQLPRQLYAAAGPPADAWPRKSNEAGRVEPRPLLPLRTWHACAHHGSAGHHPPYRACPRHMLLRLTGATARRCRGKASAWPGLSPVNACGRRGASRCMPSAGAAPSPSPADGSCSWAATTPRCASSPPNSVPLSRQR